MEKVTDFKTKVQSMSAKEIIMAMVEGLKNPIIKIRMDTFGDQEEGVCFGCAATNALCQISGKTFTENNIDGRENRAIFLNTHYRFLELFENSIDCLRKGYIWEYNEYADRINIARIEYNYEVDLPILFNYYTQSDLDFYIQLANNQN